MPPVPDKPLLVAIQAAGLTHTQLLIELAEAVPGATYTPIQPRRWAQGTPVRTPVAAWLCQRLGASPADLGLVTRECPSDHPLTRWLWEQTGADWPKGVAAWADRLGVSEANLALLRIGWTRKRRPPKSAFPRQELVLRLIKLGAPDPGLLEIDGIQVPWQTVCADWQT